MALRLSAVTMHLRWGWSLRNVAMKRVAALCSHHFCPCRAAQGDDDLGCEVGGSDLSSAAGTVTDLGGLESVLKSPMFWEPMVVYLHGAKRRGLEIAQSHCKRARYEYPWEGQGHTGCHPRIRPRAWKNSTANVCNLGTVHRCCCGGVTPIKIGSRRPRPDARAVIGTPETQPVRIPDHDCDGGGHYR